MNTEEIIILVVSIVVVVGGSLIALAVFCVTRRKKDETEINQVHNNSRILNLTSQSNSYIHYNSPGYSIRGKKSRKSSVASSGSFRSLMINRVRDTAIDDFSEVDRSIGLEGSFGRLDKVDDKIEVDCNQNISSEEITNNLINSCHGNLSGNLTEIGDITTATTNRTLHGTTTSLCEQCLTPGSPAPPPVTSTEGTSTSLPATTVEVAKAALGMTNPATASNFPVVCDSCLSPSKLGDTAKSLNLPNMRLLDLDRVVQKKVPPPVGIITNPRMKNPHLNTLRDTMFDFNVKVLPNINERTSEQDDNSFDSLLSPGKDYDWLSGDPFGYSSGEESPDDEENERMIKIQPQIKVRSSRTQSEGNYFDNKTIKDDIKERKMSYQDHKVDNKILEIELSLQPTFSVKEDLSKLPAKKQKFRVSSSKIPFGDHQIIPPPSPFRALIEVTPKKDSPVLSHSKSCLLMESRRQDSKKSLLKESIMNNSRSRLMKDVVLKQTTNEGEQNSPTSHLVWDSTFEAIKTLETSMKLIVTPMTKKIKSRVVKDDGPEKEEDEVALIDNDFRGSASSMTSNETQNKGNSSNHSNVSLTWDNSAELLDVKDDDDDAFDEVRRRNETVSDSSSVDIDEIIHRVAPNLSKVDYDIIEEEAETLRPSKASRFGELLERNPQLSRSDKFSSVLNSPLLHQTVYLSVTTLDECSGEEETPRSQFESSPYQEQLSTQRSSSAQLPSPIQFSLASSASSLSVPSASALSLSSSPMSQLEDYLSLCSSLDSYKTIINDDSDA